MKITQSLAERFVSALTVALILCSPGRAAAQIDPGGGVGSGPLAGNLTVVVIDARTLQPVPDAFCQVGVAPGNPFGGNLKMTDASGQAVFDNAALSGPQTVTVGKDGYTYQTIFNVDAREMVLPINQKNTQVPKALYEGDITSGFDIASNDGIFDAAIVLPALGVDDLTTISNFGQFAPIVLDDFPLVGEQPIPGLIYMPLQVEFLFIPLERVPYYLWLEDQSTQDIFAFYGKIPTSTLLDQLGSDTPDFLALIQDFDVQKYGLAEGVVVNGPGTEDFELTNGKDDNFWIEVDNTLPGTDVFLVSAADLDGQSGLGRIVPAGFDGIPGGSPVVARLAAIGGPAFNKAAGDPFANADYVAAALQSDTAAVALANSAVIDRSGLSVGDTASATTFFLPPSPSSAGAFLSWSSVDNPGVSPFPDLHRISIGLVKTIPDTNPGSETGDTLDVGTPLWDFIVDGGTTSFSIPRIANVTPGIVDPATTAEQDRLDWSVFAFGLTLPPVFDYDNWNLNELTLKSTHIAFNSERFIAYPDSLYTSVPIASHVSLDTFLIDTRPNPFREGTTLSFDLTEVAGSARLEVFDVSGRRIRLLLDSVAAGRRFELGWDGTDDLGQSVPAGSYLLRLEVGGQVSSKKVIKAP